MNLVERTAFQLDHQQQALIEEFESWRLNSQSGTVHTKHNSQICRIAGSIEEFLLKQLPSHIPAGDEPFEQSRYQLKGLLYANHIWSFFRSKFALRLIDHKSYTLKLVVSLKLMLNCADEFAWNCYEPVRKRATDFGTLQPDEFKEPPLTFFASDAGPYPYMAQRSALFVPEGIAGNSQDFKRFNAVLQELPVPIIGLPWSQSNHLPAAVVIAHEVGHLIERDFVAAAAFKDGIMAVMEIEESRRTHWCNWASELFADTYGILCAGPAYLLALIDFLLAPERIVVHETLAEKDAKAYPTRALRIAFNLALLKLLDLPDEGTGQLWDDAYPKPSLPSFDKFCADAPLVAAVFLKTPLEKLGGAPVTSVMKLTPEQWSEIIQMAHVLLERSSLTVDNSDEQRFRKWFTAATWAYHRNPDTFIQSSKQRLLLEALAKTITGTTRAVRREETAQMDTTAVVERAGQELMAHFRASEMEA